MVGKGDIVLVQFLFSDLSQAKLRPAVILWVNPTGDDITLCAITSQNVDQLSPEDIPLLPADPEFSGALLNSSMNLPPTPQFWGASDPQSPPFLNARRAISWGI